jgi:hypothetical protein
MATERIYQGEDAQWYFNVRGNQTMGPFTSHSEAESALDAHVGACKRRLDFSSLLPELLGPLKARRRAQAQPRHP